MKRFILISTCWLIAALLLTRCDSANSPSGSGVESTPAGADDVAAFAGVLDLPETPLEYTSIELPDHLDVGDIRAEDNEPGNNRVTDWGATLGRVLFYDVNLSSNQTTSCASCHSQEHGFSDPERFSQGFEGGLTGRNSMGLANARFYRNGRFFWDERAESLEHQVLMPIQDEVEMGLTLDELVARVGNEDYYASLFRLAFGDEEVTSDRISLALAQFVRCIVSFDSPYDTGLANAGGNRDANFTNFSALENQGKNLFLSNRTRCSDCHDTDLFVGDEARNNGLDATTTDPGLAAVTGNTNDEGKFKVPSMRNIELTAPYMHDGRFATLRAVVNHYNNGVRNHPNLDRRLEGNNGQPHRLNLSNQEIDALVAFMETLTGPGLATDEKFSDPFVR